ncbi:hypothetical protein KFE25_013580 [Diacronema lutheri]|uniref:Uncharacterized protein n=2 Tax=Diacronema lutheri TaxID=2081491 RepID=A0A8J5XU77_DIALT|nr:hypothetical protein KFE25_013580 [Diacronema lutheri]
MLVSETSALESTMRSGELDRQFRRLSLYVDRLGNINMQATLIAGFAFSTTAPDVLEVIVDNKGPLSTIYVVLIFISISLSCWVVAVSLNTQIKAEKLAMEGPDGSVRYALAAIIKVSDLIAQLHSCAAACLGGAMLAIIWNYLQPAVAAILTFLLLLLFWHAAKYNQELDELFSLEGKRLVGRGEHLQRALLVAASEEEEREAQVYATQHATRGSRAAKCASCGGKGEPLLKGRSAAASAAAAALAAQRKRRSVVSFTGLPPPPRRETTMGSENEYAAEEASAREALFALRPPAVGVAGGAGGATGGGAGGGFSFFGTSLRWPQHGGGGSSGSRDAQSAKTAAQARSAQAPSAAEPEGSDSLRHSASSMSSS